MSRALIARSPDLAKLVSEGYSLRIVDDALLVVDQVPYVSHDKRVSCASLVMVLTMQGDATVKPEDHVVYWTGSPPCRADGVSLADKLGGSPTAVGPFTDVLMLSAKANYQDYHHKVETYVEHLGREARRLGPKVSARRVRNCG